MPQVRVWWVVLEAHLYTVVACWHKNGCPSIYIKHIYIVLPIVSVLVHTLEASLSTEGHFSAHKDNACEPQYSAIIFTEPHVLYQAIARAVTKTIMTKLYWYNLAIFPSSTFIPTCSSLYTHLLLIRYPSALCQYPSPPPFYPSFPCHLPCTSYPPNHLPISITNNLSHMPLCLNLLTIHPKSHPPTGSTQQGQGEFYDWFIKM